MELWGGGGGKCERLHLPRLSQVSRWSWASANRASTSNWERTQTKPRTHRLGQGRRALLAEKGKCNEQTDKEQRERQNLLVKANTRTSPAGAHAFSTLLYYTRCLKLSALWHVKPGQADGWVSAGSDTHTTGCPLGAEVAPHNPGRWSVLECCPGACCCAPVP